MRRLLVRPPQAALILGSGELVADLIGAGWLQPIVAGHRLVLYAYRDLERCVSRLEGGESLPAACCFKLPNAPGQPAQEGKGPGDVTTTLSFAGLLKGTVTAPPLLVRPAQACALLGSEELVDDFRHAGWLRPIETRHRVTLYSIGQLENCVARLEMGQTPGKTTCTKEKSKTKSDLTRRCESGFEPTVELPPRNRIYRKTRRPMPAS
jgi:hypothetical protein